MHLVAFMHQQQLVPVLESAQNNEMGGRKSEDNIEVAPTDVGRQFLNLAPSSVTQEPNELSNSSSGERTHSGSLHNNNLETMPKRPRSDLENKKGLLDREESPDSETQGLTRQQS
ncbi:hypothetical protein QQ045_021794 [Rhodiola kirilowii]